MKKKISIWVGLTILSLGLIYQTSVIFDLQKLRTAVENIAINTGVSEMAKKVDLATEHRWKFVEYVCPYYSFKYNLSPFYGLPFEATKESSSETYTYLIFKNDSGQITYVAVKTSKHPFCTK